ncbi:MAG: hypothetical protein V1647_01080 [Pseudomonadota bacterium]
MSNMLNFIIAILLSHSVGNSSSCFDKVPLNLKLSKNTLYTYQNSLSVTRWVKGNETNAVHETNNFTTAMTPVSKDEKGFFVYEVVTKADSTNLFYLIGKSPARLPDRQFYPFFPIGLWEESKDQNPSPIKYANCGQIFKTAEKLVSSDGKLKIDKSTINKIHDVSDKRIQLESRRTITLKGEMDGQGTEETTTYLVDGTAEVANEKTVFRYEYRIGYGDTRRTEIMTGEYTKKLVKRSSYKKPGMYFPELTLPKDTIGYFTNKNGLFIPVKLNNSLSVKVYLEPTSPVSYVDYSFYIENFKGTPKDYFYPIEKLEVGKNTVINPPFGVIDTEQEFGTSEYKIPGKMGADIVSKGAIQINEKKRTVSFYEPEKKDELKEDGIEFDLIDDMAVFDLTVNGTTAKAVISFDSEEPEISLKLKKDLALKTRKIALSEKDPNENYIEKTDIIISPPNKTYIKTEAVVKDFGPAPYDIKLGRNYIKNKTLTVDYRNKWLLIK